MSPERLRAPPNPEKPELYPEDIELSLWAKLAGTISGSVSELPVDTVLSYCVCGGKTSVLLENNELESEELEEGGAIFHKG